ncbi:sperm flagellar protein 1-like isoform X2 [Octopus sinensis]|uniref:Sperm flagellar protein 1-like isoform X2 n=1 Tax=Octopus sinensis TaxID=2607531 RepID=A0A7E6EKQ8_9MOLL|nr:sperm flagellar protein 1-like isoform X2 [Octopus sinensis]
MELEDAVLEDIYSWVDQHRLSRPKRNIARDFCDGVLIAEIIHQHQPKLVELHNYTPVNATKQKMENLYLLNRRVFSKMKFELSDEVICAVAYCKPYAIEKVLLFLRSRLETFNNKEWAHTSYLKFNLDQKTVPLLDPPEQEFQNQLPQNCDQPEADQSTCEPFLYRRNKKTVKSQAIQKPFAFKNDPISISQLEGKHKESLAKDETIKNFTVHYLLEYSAVMDGHMSK